MPYVTLRMTPQFHQVSLDEILKGTISLERFQAPKSNTTSTRTTFRHYLDRGFVDQFDILGMVNSLVVFNQTHKDLFEVDRASLYYTFHIPKKSGGLREINAPEEPLMNALRELKELFESFMGGATYHTSAFAYVKGRSTIDAVKRHQMNNSKWFAKFDFSNFFGSTTIEYVMNVLVNIFPFSNIVRYRTGREALERALSLCFLNGGLPQGTPISPLITNIMMIPIDYKMCNELKARPENFVYTRYADDLLISSRQSFNCEEIQNYIVEVLAQKSAPFTLNTKKTRYGSSAGRNWNLGVMLNKDNQITIGHQKKKQFKAMCCNYINDRKNDIRWDIHDVQVFQGLISYYRMVEKDYIDYVIKHNNEKFNIDLEKCIKEDLNV